MRQYFFTIFVIFIFTLSVKAQTNAQKYGIDTLEECNACENTIVSILDLKHRAGIDSVFFAHLGCQGMILYQPFSYVKLKDTIHVMVSKRPDSLFIYQHAPTPGQTILDLSNLVFMNNACYFPILGRITLTSEEKEVSDAVSKFVRNTNPDVYYWSIDDVNKFLSKQKKQGRMVYVLWKSIIQK